MVASRCIVGTSVTAQLVKNPLGSIPGLERSSREGKVYPLQYSGLKNSKESERTERLSLFLAFVL